MSASLLLEQLDRAIMESLDNTDLGWRTIYDRGDAPATYTGGMRGPRWARSVPSLHDRDEGRFFPFYVEERDLEEMRAKARHLGTFTSVATGALQATSVYTMGGEWEYKFVGKKDQPTQPAPELLNEMNAVLKAVLEKNQWIGDLDCEIHDTSRQDGDTIVAGYKGPDGIADFRRYDGDVVREPRDATPLNRWLDLPGKVSWTFGVHTIEDARMRRVDHERHVGYHCVFDDGGRDWDYLPAWSQPHGDAELCDKFGHLIKRNVPRRAKRGVSDFWPCQTDIEREAKINENLAVGTAVLAGIPWFETFSKGKTRDQAQASMERGLDLYSRAVTANRAGASGDSRTVQVRPPGTVVKRGEGVELTMGPLGQVRQPIYIEVCAYLLRSIGRRWLMPEYMISGDASNANFASTLVAESPFVKAREADQRFYAGHFRMIMWKAIKMAFDHGRFARFNITFQALMALVDLNIQPPMVASRDKANHLAELDQLWNAGLLNGNEYRIDLKREPKPEYENKTYEPPRVPGQIEQGLAEIGAKQPGAQDGNGPPKDPASGKDQGPNAEPKPKPAQAGPAGDRKEQIRAEAFTRAIEGAATVEEARAIAGRFRTSLEGRWVTLNGGSGEDGHGGTRVYIDGDGDVQAGPPALQGKDLDEKPAGPQKSSKAPSEKPAPAGGSHRIFSGKDESDSWGKQHHGKWAASLSTSERDAIEDYTGADYSQINGALRGGMNAEKGQGQIARQAREIDSAISKAPPLDADTVLFRGMGKGAGVTFKVGQEFSDKGFVSTSMDRNVGDDFAVGDGAFIRINAPKGTRGAYVDLLSPNDTEQEFLLPRGSRFKVRKITKGKIGAAVIDVDLIQ